MERILIYEEKSRADMTRLHTRQLGDNLNQVVTAFHQFQKFATIENESQAFTLVSDPVAYFDLVIVQHCGLMPVGDQPLSAVNVASLFNINRTGFQSAIKAPLPGAKGAFSIVLLPTLQRSLFTWSNGKFSVNEMELEKKIDQGRIFAESPEAIELVKYWQGLVELLNIHICKKLMLDTDGQRAADALGYGLQFDRGKFTLNSYEIGQRVRSITVN
jgi:hypothetical protein